MPNPTIIAYALLACLASLLGGLGGGVYIGVKWEKGDNADKVIVAQNAAIEGANKAAAAELERQRLAAKKEADARVANSTARMKGELDAAKKSRPECARDAESIGLLRSAIGVANGKADAAPVVPSVVRSAGGTAGWLGTFSTPLGVQGSRAVRPVPTPP